MEEVDEVVTRQSYASRARGYRNADVVIAVPGVFINPSKSQSHNLLKLRNENMFIMPFEIHLSLEESNEVSHVPKMAAEARHCDLSLTR